MRYPRIRLERSSSYPRLVQHQKTVGDNKEDVQPGSETEQAEMKNRAKDCVFNLSGDSPRSKPRFKIFFNSGGGGDINVPVGNGSTRNDTKVNNCFFVASKFVSEVLSGRFFWFALFLQLTASVFL